MSLSTYSSMAAMLRDSVVVVFAVVCTRPRAIPLAMITMRKSTHGFPFLSYMSMGLRRSSAITSFPHPHGITGYNSNDSNKKVALSAFNPKTARRNSFLFLNCDKQEKNDFCLNSQAVNGQDSLAERIIRHLLSFFEGLKV